MRVTRFGVYSLSKSVHARPRMSNERGQSLLEFAVAVPILMLIVTGIATFGIAFNQTLVLTDAVAIGGRYLAVSRSNTLDPCSDVSKAVRSAASSLTPANLQLTLNLYDSSGNSKGSSSGAASAFSCPSLAPNLTQNGSAQLRATYPCRLAVFGGNLIPSCNLSTQITEVIQ